MRSLSRAIVGALLVLPASGCLGSSAPPPPPPPACAHLARPSVALAIRLSIVPGRARALCIARQYSAVFATGRWGTLPTTMRAENPNLLLWQQRSLLYACNGCPTAVFSLDWMRRYRPEWILHTADGLEIHPLGDPQMVLVDFANINYQALWADRVDAALARGGWTGVEVMDAGNAPGWDGSPIDHTAGANLGKPITEVLRRTYLEQALSVTHAPILAAGFRVAVRNTPPTVIDPREILGANAVDVDQGFAGLAGVEWTQLFRYFDTALLNRAGPVVWDDTVGLDPSRRVYGFASYLLVAGTQWTAYGAPGDASDPLYRLPLGTLDDGPPPQLVDGAWVRVFTGGTAAVDPGSLPATVQINGRPVVLQPETAMIVAGSRRLTGSATG